MGDLKKPGLIYLKGGLFLLGGLLSAAILLLERPDLRTAALLILCVWCFCRCYYFVFYVIQHYVDADYRFAGLGDFCKYVWKKRQGRD